MEQMKFKPSSSVLTMTDKESAVSLDEIYSKYETLQDRAEKSQKSDLSTITTLEGATVKTKVAKAKSKLNLSYRGKIIVATYIIVMALLGFLVIYNAISLSALSVGIVATEVAVASAKDELNEVKESINEINDEYLLNEAQKMGYSRTNVERGVETISITPNMNSSAVAVAPTNWFDAVCQFFANLFGG